MNGFLDDVVLTVIDVETTGLDPAVDGVCEIGWHRVLRNDDGRWVSGFHGSALCNPGIPIPPTASAIHHITDRMVRDAPSPIEVWNHVCQETSGVFCAHNAEFDSRFVRSHGWLCSMRLAKHLWPDAPGYGNQVLRYWRGYEEIPIYLGYPSNLTHRAEFDAATTATLLIDMLNFIEAAGIDARSMEALIAFAEAPVVLRGKVGFGKWADRTWDTVPYDYLQWMAKENRRSIEDKGDPAWDRDQVHTVNYYLTKR